MLAETLDEGARYVAEALGVAPKGGGRHDRMGTHNRLLRLGEDAYLEVIARDPGAADPDGPRWFGLDDFNGPPRLAAWVARADDLGAAIAAHPGALTPPIEMRRGDTAWRFASTGDGRVPAGGLPYLIAWDGPHPASSLPDRAARLRRLTVTTSDPVAARYVSDIDGVTVGAGAAVTLQAEIETAGGLRRLG